MAIIILSMKNVLGNCDFTKRKITIYSQSERALEIDTHELKRLTDLGECCIKVAQTLGNKEIRKLTQKLNLINYGSEEYPIYETDMHWFFGVIEV